MRTPLAWANVTHNKARTLTALGGVTFAILLVFMQLGFYGSCASSATLMHDLFDFDLLLVSPHYLALRNAGSFPKERLSQAEAAPGVARVSGIHVASANWRNPEAKTLHDTLLLGLDPSDRPFLLTQLNEQLPLLQRNDTAIVDRTAHKVIGPREPGTSAEVGGRKIRIVGDYEWGTGFNALMVLLVNEQTLVALATGARSRDVQIGLVRLDPDGDPDVAMSALREVLPGDVRVLDREALALTERRYWVKLKPIGLIFTSGVIVALLVGTVILYQILSADVTNHMREYATLKAIGYRPQQIQTVVLQQGVLFAFLGFIPASLLATGLYVILRKATNLPITMTIDRLLVVLGLSLLMCALSGLLAIRRVTAADPADLF